ncbi:L-asparaginase II [Rubrobacter xylanophilus DSM 9941]|uniref:L-asparaginase II n=1 Tax=Rubrobacter xylanophilus (strain DSM 9941 / JCM 11954 / NBRC 16129 / PRD-1) TaxID=266117 RepID=Q1AX37_RUBXD|nr:asparaginase [Rubrobacter xylanophilus]ABG04041.1 L-asparaginase II [Rubrobacter xylanophilus DSM 9941]
MRLRGRVETAADVPLVVLTRGGLVEGVHRGRVAVCDASGAVLEAAGDPDAPVCLRSSAKPFQAMPLVLSGAADAFGLGEEELAVACASHNGERAHLEAVRSILRKAGLPEEALQSGAHPPLHAPAAEELARSGERPRALHGNCSGKHAGMLAVCAHQGWDTGSYREPAHPVQRWILEIVARVCGVDRESIPAPRDGCGVPTFAVPLRGLAAGFARLATGRELPDRMAAAARRLREAMRARPFMVAGTGRFDTDLMQKTPLVAKSGAEAVFAAGSPEGWGLAVKISDGASRAVRPAAVAALGRLGVAVPGERGPSEVRNLHGEPVGRLIPLV